MEYKIKAVYLACSIHTLKDMNLLILLSVGIHNIPEKVMEKANDGWTKNIYNKRSRLKLAHLMMQ